MRIILFALLFSIISFINADEIKIGTASLKMNYVETDRVGNFLDSETSDYADIGGFSLSYKKNFGKLDSNNQQTSLELSLRQMKGDSLYNGSLQSTTTGQIISTYQTITKNEILESKIRLIQTKYTDNYNVGIFVSYGYREWIRDMSNDPYGYKEIYDWQYYDIGLKADTSDGDWDIGIEIGYQKTIVPKMVAYMSSTLEFNLGNTSGYYYKIPLGYNINKNWKIEAVYEYNQWTIGASNTVSGYYEPDSTTKNKIVSLHLVYKF